MSRSVNTREGLGNLFAKAHAGKPIRLAYLGGSITAAPGWRTQTLERLGREFPAASFDGVNAGIGGTGSDLGAFRLRQDVLAKEPDLLFVEFAVNDLGRAPADIVKSMEGIVRQSWTAAPKLDICFLYTYAQQFDEWLCENSLPPEIAAMETVAAHYGIPSINMASPVYGLLVDGSWILEAPRGGDAGGMGKNVFSTDGVHPLFETGHRVYTDAVMAGLLSPAMDKGLRLHTLPAPLDKDHWGEARLLPLEPWMLSPGWREFGRGGFAELLATPIQSLWETKSPGASLNFEFQGRFLGLYEVLGPDSGVASHVLDGKRTIASHFNDGCYIYRNSLVSVLKTADTCRHSVELTLLAASPDTDACRRRMELIGMTANADKIGTGPVWRVAYLAVIGNVESPKKGN